MQPSKSECKGLACHTNAGHFTLNDDSYNTERMVVTANPYKELVADLMRRGVQVELCGATKHFKG
jgi:hypothetical protein